MNQIAMESAAPGSDMDFVQPLTKWLREMADAGKMPGNSVRHRIGALNMLLTVLTPKEPRDLHWVLENVDDIAKRWATKNNGTNNVKDYRGRVKGAIEEYLRFLDDPLNFKPNRVERDSKKVPAKQKMKLDDGPTVSQTADSSGSPMLSSPPQPQSASPLCSFPLGDGREFSFHKPDSRWSVKDAIKTSLHLLTYASDFDPMSSQAQPIYALAKVGKDD